jgi:hypothetical protein
MLNVLDTKHRGWFIIIICCFALVGCATRGNMLPKVEDSELASPAQKFPLAYTYSYFNRSYVGTMNTVVFGEEIEKVFSQCGIKNADTKTPFTDLRLNLMLEGNTLDTQYGAIITGITLTLIPGPVQKYDLKLNAMIKKNDEIIKSYTYYDYSRLWFGLFCLPAILMDQPHNVAREVVDGMLLNLVKDLKRDGFLNLGSDQIQRHDINSDFRNAASKGNITSMKALLNKGVEVNSRNVNGATALMIASLNGHVETVKFLLSKGADVNARDNHDYTTLIHISGQGNVKIMQILLEKRAEVNAKNDLGLTALDNAELFKQQGAIKLLKKYKAVNGNN